MQLEQTHNEMNVILIVENQIHKYNNSDKTRWTNTNAIIQDFSMVCYEECLSDSRVLFAGAVLAYSFCFLAGLVVVGWRRRC